MERKTPSQSDRPGKIRRGEDIETAYSEIAPSGASNEDFPSNNSNDSGRMSSNSINDDIQSLKSDLASLKESIASLTATAATSTMGMASDAASKVSEKVSDAATLIAEKSSSMASVATEGAKSLSAEVEDLTRRNPLAALASAVVLGLLLGMASRGRS
jgi:ElaB/YqjD/DUF883 family membrane-anchored ribosome-binding protein